MFERFTEKARRVIFCARDEASMSGSPEITTEHILLGIFREAPSLMKRLVPGATQEKVRSLVVVEIPPEKRVSARFDTPLNTPAKRVLTYAREEADRLRHEHIGCEHLLLALAREKDCLAARIMRGHGFDIAKTRVEIARPVPGQDSGQAFVRVVSQAEAKAWAVIFQWEKRRCEPLDALRNLVNQRLCLYHGEPYDASQFEVVKGGWVHFYCALCSEDLYVAQDPAGSIGHTNGQDWLCPSCYERFAAPVSGEHDDVG